MGEPLFFARMLRHGRSLCLLAAAVPVAAGAAVAERRVVVMGTVAAVRLEAGDQGTARRAAEAAVAALEGAEADLSTWRDDTPLARLNRAAPGVRVPLPEGLAEELGRARTLAERTGGAFDPMVGPLVRAWGLRSVGRLPAPGELGSALAASGRRWLEVGAGWARRLHPGAAVEEGAWGKGAALDRAVAAARAAGARRGWIDLGGQVAVVGGRAVVAVADPRQRTRVALEVEVDGGSVATSGNSERGVAAAGRRVGHILDPRTGRPAPDFGSVTVWAGRALDADALATALYVMGPEEGLAWAAREPGVEALFLVVNGEGIEITATAGIGGRLRPAAADAGGERAPDRR